MGMGMGWKLVCFCEEGRSMKDLRLGCLMREGITIRKNTMETMVMTATTMTSI